jgi:hypothetical protein
MTTSDGGRERGSDPSVTGSEAVPPDDAAGSGARRAALVAGGVLTALVLVVLVVWELTGRDGGDPLPASTATQGSETLEPTSEPDETADPGDGGGPDDPASPTETPAQDPGADEETEPEPDTADPGTPDPGPDGVLPTAAPVPLSEPADFGTGVVAVLEQVRSVQTQARSPGEISGPGLLLSVRLTNDTGEPVSLDTVTVNLTDAAGVPGLPIGGPPAMPFEGRLAPGASAVGTYVFTIAEGARSPVMVEVFYSTQAPVVVFEGDPARL